MRMDARQGAQSIGRIIGVQYEVMRRALGERPVAVRRG